MCVRTVQCAEKERTLYVFPSVPHTCHVPQPFVFIFTTLVTFDEEYKSL